MDTAETIELEITGVAHGGIFVARHEGRVIFVPDAIPGERVRARITDASRPAFWRAEAVEVLEASESRRPHIWPEADIARAPHDRAGGADFGHIRLDAQRELKARVIREAFDRFAHRPVDVVVEPAGTDETPDGTGWRTRLSLHVGPDGAVGPYAARSHHIVPVTSLPLAAPALAEAALQLGTRRGDRVDLVLPSDGQVRVIERTDAPDPRRGSRSGPRRGADSAGHEVVVETARGRPFRVDASGFWQVHRLAAQTLADAVAKALASTGFDPAAPNLDLYGGVGLFAAVMGEVGGSSTRVATVESAARATHHAARNLRDWGNAEAITARVDRFLASEVAEVSEASGSSGSSADPYHEATVLLDPPRAGAGAGVVQAIAALAPRTVIYVACDPVALARDTATFEAEGYELRDLRALDLFPNSHHVEAIAVFDRAAARAATGSVASPR
ncbi:MULTISPECIES: class I SAM-dependent RNA methyltransferase [Bacteria]